MNTPEAQKQVQDLKAADIAAYKAGQKSNFITNFVRNEFIRRAFEMDPELKKPVTIELNRTVASLIVASVSLLSQDGQFPSLFEGTPIMYFNNGDISITATINAAGLSAEYREKLNEKLNIQLALV